jgi:hypothetical protein
MQLLAFQARLQLFATNHVIATGGKKTTFAYPIRPRAD